MIFLETERLILRSLREEDFEDYWAFAGDPESSRMMGRGDLSTREAAMENFCWLKDKEPRAYGLELRQTGQLIGNLTVTMPPAEVAEHPATVGKPGRSLSFCIGKPWQRMGLAFEAVQAVMEELYHREGINYINCGYFDFNEPSRCLQEKLGFARFLEQRLPNGLLAYENIRWRDYFLKTPRLTLRRFHPEDLEDYCAYAMDPYMARMVGLDDMTSRESVQRGFQRTARRPRAYALVLEEEGKVIGDLCVESLPPVFRNISSLRDKRGYALSFCISRHYRRRGLMEEAIRAVMDQLFRAESLDFVNCGYFDFNEPSRRLQEKLGFRPVATHSYRRGSEDIRVIDCIVWREAWLQHKN